MPNTHPASPTTNRSRLVILSPHRDDAAFSAGLLLGLAAAAHLPVTIVNLFTESTYAPFASTNLSREAVTALRLAEDQAVTSLLGPAASLHDCHLLDAPLRLGIPDDQVLSFPLSAAAQHDQLRLIEAALPDLADAGLILAPLALGSHIDHVLTRDAALSLLPPGRLGLYQDLPYASRTPNPLALAGETAAILAAAPAGLQPCLLRAGEEPVPKRSLLSCYPSQVAPETIDEMDRWTVALGGECLYLTPAARAQLQSMLPSARLTPAPGTPTPTE